MKAHLDEKIINILGLSKIYHSGGEKIFALNNINLSINHGEYVAIVGPSGSGKSTLLNMIGCLDTPDSGLYEFFGYDTNQLSTNELSNIRNKKIGFIFQQYNLISNLTVLENVLLPSMYAKVNKKGRKEKGINILKKLDLVEKINSFPAQLSGGQQQRVSIARALANGGELILADEPTGALDTESGACVMNILGDLNKCGHTIIVITHDRDIANHAARIIELKNGLIISDDCQSKNSRKEVVQEYG